MNAAIKSEMPVLSIRVKPEIAALVMALRMKMTARLGDIATKTDVIESAIRLLAKKEKV